MSKKKKSNKTRLFEGLPVIDADHDIDLVIKPIDIKNSKKKDPGQCAAALAGRRELKKDVRVFLSRMYVKEKKNWVRYLTPNNAAREIVSFDRGSGFEPGEYIFKKASPGQQLGIKRGNNHRNTGIGQKKKQVHHMTANVRIRASY